MYVVMCVDLSTGPLSGMNNFYLAKGSDLHKKWKLEGIRELKQGQCPDLLTENPGIKWAYSPIAVERHLTS